MSFKTFLNVVNHASKDFFGISVSISNDVAIVGSFRDDDDGLDSGSAYIFRYDGLTWVEEQKLTASDAGEVRWFGLKTSISGDVAVISALDTEIGGAVYVFRYNGIDWMEEQKLSTSDESNGDFGSAVDIQGDVIVVGSSRDEDNGSYSGAVYVFRYDGSLWLKEQKLLASDALAGDRFGSNVSVDEGLVLIGRNLDNAEAGDLGGAYIFRYNGNSWIEEQKLVASDAEGGDRYGGSAVSLSGNVALVGSHLDGGIGNHHGSVYVFRFDGSDWIEEQKLIDARRRTIWSRCVDQR